MNGAGNKTEKAMTKAEATLAKLEARGTKATEAEVNLNPAYRRANARRRANAIRNAKAEVLNERRAGLLATVELIEDQIAHHRALAAEAAAEIAAETGDDLFALLMGAKTPAHEAEAFHAAQAESLADSLAETEAKADAILAEIHAL